MKTQTFKKGEQIIIEGTFETWACVIKSGKVEVSTLVNGERKVLAALHDTEIFGEMGLIDDKARSSSVTALEDTIINIFTREDFKVLFLKDPKVIMPILKSLFARLRSVSKMVSTDCQRCGKQLW
ncbi:MAG: Crp/Fnr family transcriptional regulator [Candidatus Anammoxibacter sp.]